MASSLLTSAGLRMPEESHTSWFRSFTYSYREIEGRMSKKHECKRGRGGREEGQERTWMPIQDRGRRGKTYRRALGRVGGKNASEEVLGGLGEIGCVALVRLPEPVGASLLCDSKGGREGGREEE